MRRSRLDLISTQGYYLTGRSPAEARVVFVIYPWKHTQTNLGKHAIDTQGAYPVKQPLGRMAPKWEEEANREVEEMLRNEICLPPNSPWNGSVVLVKKRDGTMRFAINYRALNDVMKLIPCQTHALFWISCEVEVYFHS